MAEPAVAGAHRLSVAGLSLSRGARILFSDLSWQLQAGEAMILRGANGSGKTSLLTIIGGRAQRASRRLIPLEVLDLF